MNILPKFKTLAIKQVLLLSTLVVLGSFVNPLYAYQTDHGLLPAGASACAAHVPVTLAVPPAATAEPAPGDFSHGFYHIEELNNGLFYITDGLYQAMFLVSEKGIVLVDAPPSIGLNNADPANSVSLVEAIYSIDQTHGKPITTLVYSHSHIDHIGAASIVLDAFPKLKIIAHKETKRLISKGSGEIEGILPGAGSNPPPLPTETFTRYKTVETGAQRLRLSYDGEAHEPGNIFIFAPAQNVLMLVDVIFPRWSPFSNLALAKSVHDYLEAYDKVLAFDFTTFIGGHFNRIGTREDVQQAKLYMDDIKANALSALKNPNLFAIFGQVPNNGLGAFHVYLDQMACECANLTLDPATTPSGVDWLNEIGNADVGTLTHCWTIGEAMRIDAEF